MVDGAVEGRVGVDVAAVAERWRRCATGPGAAVPLKSICSRKCERPPPQRAPSWMLPVFSQTCTEHSAEEVVRLEENGETVGEHLAVHGLDQNGRSRSKSRERRARVAQ